MYYIQTQGNTGYLYILLPGNDEYTVFNIEYAGDRRLDIKESQARPISINDLPDVITRTFDFGRLKDSIREVYLISPLPIAIEKKKCSRFEYAIKQAAKVADIEDYEPFTALEEIQQRQDNMQQQADKLILQNPVKP